MLLHKKAKILVDKQRPVILVPPSRFLPAGWKPKNLRIKGLVSPLAVHYTVDTTPIDMPAACDCCGEPCNPNEVFCNECWQCRNEVELSGTLSVSIVGYDPDTDTDYTMNTNPLAGCRCATDVLTLPLTCTDTFESGWQFGTPAWRYKGEPCNYESYRVLWGVEFACFVCGNGVTFGMQQVSVEFFDPDVGYCYGGCGTGYPDPNNNIIVDSCNPFQVSGYTFVDTSVLFSGACGNDAWASCHYGSYRFVITT